MPATKKGHDRSRFHCHIAANMAADTNQILKIGLPKGSLFEPTLDLFEKAGRQVAMNATRTEIGRMQTRARHALVELAQLQAELPD